VSGDAGTAGATAGRTPTQNALVGPTQFTPPHQTRHKQDRLVVSGVRRCEVGIILTSVWSAEVGGAGGACEFTGETAN